MKTVNIRAETVTDNADWRISKAQMMALPSHEFQRLFRLLHATNQKLVSPIFAAEEIINMIQVSSARAEEPTSVRAPTRTPRAR